MLLTRIRNLDGPLSKSLTLEDGKLVKTAAASLVNGMAYRVVVDDIEHLAQIMDSLRAGRLSPMAFHASSRGLLRRKNTRFAVWPGKAPFLVIALTSVACGPGRAHARYRPAKGRK